MPGYKWNSYSKGRNGRKGKQQRRNKYASNRKKYVGAKHLSKTQKKEVRKIATEEEDPKCYLGIEERYPEICMTVAGGYQQSVYTPYTSLLGTDWNAFWSFSPEFVRGDGDAVWAGNLNGTTSNTMESGHQISGESVFIKGVKYSFWIGENANRDTDRVRNKYRFMGYTCSGRDGTQNDMGVNDWARRYNCRSLGTGLSCAAEIAFAIKNPDNDNKYGKVFDSEWRNHGVNTNPNHTSTQAGQTEGENELETSYSYNDVIFERYQPVNRRFDIAGNNKLRGWKTVNICMLYTGKELQYTPSVYYKCDIFYTD